MVSKPVICLNDEPAEDDEAGEIENCGRFLEKLSQSQPSHELWSAFDYQDTMVSLKQL